MNMLIKGIDENNYIIFVKIVLSRKFFIQKSYPPIVNYKINNQLFHINLLNNG
jgi:hypothetical protein